MAAAKIFAIPELLESILLELHGKDLKTVLLAQHINKTFRDTIKSSIKIQRALFLKPDPTRDPQAKPRINPFLLDIIHMICKTHRLSVWLDVADDSDRTPLLGLWKKDDGFHLCVEIASIKPLTRPVRQGLEAANASWQRMMATDPPLPLFIQDTVFEGEHTDCVGLLLGEFPMREIVAKLEEAVTEMIEYHTWLRGE